jgi:hypothetical protein
LRGTGKSTRDEFGILYILESGSIREIDAYERENCAPSVPCVRPHLFLRRFRFVHGASALRHRGVREGRLVEKVVEPSLNDEHESSCTIPSVQRQSPAMSAKLSPACSLFAAHSVVMWF